MIGYFFKNKLKITEMHNKTYTIKKHKKLFNLRINAVDHLFCQIHFSKLKKFPLIFGVWYDII